MHIRVANLAEDASGTATSGSVLRDKGNYHCRGIEKGRFLSVRLSVRGGIGREKNPGWGLLTSPLPSVTLV